MTPENTSHTSALMRASRLESLAGREFTLSPTHGRSLNNELWRLEVDGLVRALRVPPDPDALALDRVSEAIAARAGAMAGAAPLLLDADDSGLLLWDWVDGREWGWDDLERPGGLTRAIGVVLTAQVAAPDGLRSLPDIVAGMLDRARELDTEVPKGLERQLDLLADLDARAATRHPRVLTHHDAWPNNMLDDGDRLWLVDWEFAGAGDGMADFAVLAMASGTSRETVGSGSADGLLELVGRRGERDRLVEAMWSIHLFEAVWALASHAARGSDGGFDYAQHARNMFAVTQETEPVAPKS